MISKYYLRIAKLTKERLSFLKGSKVPDTLYHISPKEFDQFKQQYRGGLRSSDMGFHFGGEKTVQSILKHIGKGDHLSGWEKGDPLYKYHVKLNIKNPLRLKENRLGSWAANDIVQETMESEPPVKGITDKMVDDYYNDEIFLKNKEEWWGDSSSEEEKNRNTIKWLRELGFDGIVYDNSYEGGGDSYIAFEPNQIKIIKKEKIK